MQVAKLTGKVFLQKSTVNLLSSVLDTPEYFWDVPDSLQMLYDKVRRHFPHQARSLCMTDDRDATLRQKKPRPPPEIHWHLPLAGQVCEYRELEGRVELMNARFEIMQVRGLAVQ